MTAPYPSALRSLFIGFEPLFAELNNLEVVNAYPPHNLIKLTNDWSVLELAVAGFSEDELDLEVKESVLTIRGEKKKEKTYPDDVEYIHRGIAQRKFTRVFHLAEYVTVKEASVSDGILRVHLNREVPEEKKPQKIKLKK